MNAPSSTQQHYDSHLGPIYSWMLGDFATALQRNRDFFVRHGIKPGVTGIAVDLGAGNGLQAIPLAELGFQLIAVDLCASLLAELKQRTGSLTIRCVEAELLEFTARLTGQVDVIVCMGDTLTHLPSQEAVTHLLHAAADRLAPSGNLVLTFRDYVTAELRDTARFIPVRSDADRILTCFLEYGDGVVTVHDLVHTRLAAGWRQAVSSYRKLRLDPAWVAAELTRAGLEPIHQATERGLVTLIARKPNP